MATSANPHEVDQLRDRVRRYLQVLLIIDVGAHVKSKQTRTQLTVDVERRR